MDSGLVTSLSGAIAQAKRVEVISNNIANADTPAFKGSDLSFEETLLGTHRDDLRSDIPERPYKNSELLSKAGTESRGVLYGGEYTDLKSGGFKLTNNPLDIAIEGNGFLEVLTPNGVRLTRAGNLALDPGGRLMTSNGFLVLGAGQNNAAQDPALRAINVGNNGKVQIDIEGNIYTGNEQGNALVGRLSLIQVVNPAALRSAGGNLFEAPPEAIARPVQAPAGQAAQQAAARQPAQAGEELPVPKENPLGSLAVAPKVHQGLLESSNVNPVVEMTRLIEAHRLYDQNLKLMQSIGDANARVSEVGKF